jgi:hypothetical protein
MEEILLLDETLRVIVYYEAEDKSFEDNVCLCIEEDCPEEERVFRAQITSLYLTRDQARRLAEALLKAVERSWEDSDTVNG